MAKRFTAIEKWQDEWFSHLKPIEKLVFIFMTDNCDNAGFFEINARMNAFMIGISIDEYITAFNNLSKTYEWGRDRKKVYITNFLKYQNNLPLKESNNYHKQIIKIIISNLENFEHIKFFSPFLPPKQSLQSLQSPLVLVLGLGKEDNKEEKVENVNIWDTMPKSDIDLQLPGRHIKSAIEQIKITRNVLMDEKKVMGMYEAFKIQNLTGKKYYQDEAAVFSHFTNWLKIQNFRNYSNGGSQQEPEQLTTAEALAKQKSISSKYN